MDKEELIQNEPTLGPIESAQGSGFLVGALFALFAIVEAVFLADLYTLSIHHAHSEYLLSAIGFQSNLIVSLLCFWRLWRRKFILKVGQTKQNFFTLYLSLALLTLLASILLYSEIGPTVYQVSHPITP